MHADPPSACCFVRMCSILTTMSIRRRNIKGSPGHCWPTSDSTVAMPKVGGDYDASAQVQHYAGMLQHSAETACLSSRKRMCCVLLM